MTMRETKSIVKWRDEVSTVQRTEMKKSTSKLLKEIRKKKSELWDWHVTSNGYAPLYTGYNLFIISLQFEQSLEKVKLVTIEFINNLRGSFLWNRIMQHKYIPLSNSS